MSQSALVVTTADLAEHLRLIVREEIERALSMQPQSPWMTTAQAAEHTGLSEQALRALRKRDAIPSHTSPQGHVRFRRDELDAYLDADFLARSA
jgi:excisionase family DNA binding protein